MSRPHILVIPFPAQGHLIPMLDLAHLLSLHTSGRISLSLLITPSNLPLIQPFLSATPSAAPLLLPLPSHPSLPPRVEHVRDLPSHLHSAVLSLPLSLLRPQILSWARSQSNPLSFILSDFFLGWTQELASELGIPRIAFYCSGAFAVAGIDYTWQHLPPPGDKDTDRIPLTSLPSSPSLLYSQLPSVFRHYRANRGNPDWEFIRESFNANARSWGAAINTFDALEGEFVSYLKKSYGHDRVWAVGPLKPIGNTTSRGGGSSVSSEELNSWLAACPPRSVVYVCFGSQYTPSESQARALATAIELSGTRFLWALGGSHVAVPDGFEERNKGTGLVIGGWAPQVEILRHVAVGSFLTHCGWNSLLEGVTAGVTLLAWPMKADQFINARLVVEGKRVAAAVAEGADAVPDPAELGRVMAESVEEKAWPEMRERAAEMGRSAAEAVDEGGSSYRDLMELVRHVFPLG